MAKATTMIGQVLNPQRGYGYQTEYAAWIASNQSLFNQIAIFFLEVTRPMRRCSTSPIKKRSQLLRSLFTPHRAILLLLCRFPTSKKIFLQCSGVPLSMRLLGRSGRSFYVNLSKWRKRKEKAEAKERQEIHRTSSSSATHLEQIHHTLCRPVERPDRLNYPHQGLDGTCEEWICYFP